MWIYEQKNGRFCHDQNFISFGYSGHSDGKNNPFMQAVPNVGPIPKGYYTIGPSFDHPKKGKLCMRLFPRNDTTTFERTGFMMHGDSIHDPGTASEGCIIQPKSTRLMVATDRDKLLLVI